MYEEEKEFILKRLKFILKKYKNFKPKKTEQKAAFDLVSNIDKEIEAYLIKEINKKFKGDKILSEEINFNQTLSDSRCWIIDPIDGTCNMIHGIPIFAIQVSFCVNFKCVFSIIEIPSLNEEYIAIKEKGAYLNGKKLKVNKDIELQNTIVSFTSFAHNKFGYLKHKVIGDLFMKIGKIRMFGASSVDFAFLASSRIDGLIMWNTNPWDIIPGLLICKEAGAILTDIDGFEHNLETLKGVCIANNKTLHNLLLDTIKKNNM